jgi:hypothetical protein
MRRRGTWGAGLALLLALGAGAGSAADKDAKPPVSRYGSKTVFEGLFGSDEKKPAPKPAKDKGKEKARTESKSRDKDGGEAAPKRSAAAELREREEAKLLRRLEVCDRLQKVARETNDADLEQLAQELDKKAWEVYRERTASLAGNAALLEGDADRLDKSLPVEGDGGKKLTEGGKKKGEERGRTAQVREVNP